MSRDGSRSPRLSAGRVISPPGSASRPAILVDSRLPPGAPFVGLLLAQPYPEPFVERDMHHTFEIGVLMAGRQRRSFEEWATTLGPGGVYLTPDGKSYVYSVGASLGELYLAEGLR